MDLLSRIVTLVEDLREIPHFKRIGDALKRAGADGFRTSGYVMRDQAERIPDRRQGGMSRGGRASGCLG